VGTLGTGLAAALGVGLAAAVDGAVLPQPAPSKAMAAVIAVTINFDCMGMLLNTLTRTHSDTRRGYDFEIYSGVT